MSCSTLWKGWQAWQEYGCIEQNIVSHLFDCSCIAHWDTEGVQKDINPSLHPKLQPEDLNFFSVRRQKYLIFSHKIFSLPLIRPSNDHCAIAPITFINISKSIYNHQVSQSAPGCHLANLRLCKKISLWYNPGESKQ